MSEPDAGSPRPISRPAPRPDGKNYIVNGTKVFSTFSPEAAVFLVYVRYGPGVGGIGSVLIERGTPGFTIGPPQEFMSGEQWSELHFENCRIPAENVLLGPGGFKKQMASFNVERLGNTARSLAFGRYCYERAREHAGVRQQFGRPLAEFQGLQWKFADMAIKLEGAQLLLYRAAANADKACRRPMRRRWRRPPAISRLRGGARVDADHGRDGYSKTSLVEYCMRRCRGWMIAGGSVEMLKNRIAEHVFDRRFDQRPPKPKTSEARSDGRACFSEGGVSSLSPLAGRGWRAAKAASRVRGR
jgi:alkylation response protein AidB-like acyl-CoA dehydrogenase